jgi:type I restriction enzyme, S subunit
MKPYPAYKDSGIEWIGEIPEHWEVTRLQNIGTFSASGIDKKINPDEPIVSMVNYMDIYGNPSKEISPKRHLMQVSCATNKISSCGLRRGDLVFTPSSETKEDIGLSALITEDLVNTVFSYHTIRFRLDIECHYRFRKYLCNNYFVLNQFSHSSKGTTRQILVRDDFKNIQVLIPLADEQQAIADYLDKKTALIDDLIGKKERQIELLKEQRQAVINQAVTKGLDPNVEMKDSGIEWLGEIPEHWDVKKGKYLFNIISGYAPEQITFSDNADNRYFRVDDLNSNADSLFLSDSKAKFVLGDTPLYPSNTVLFPKRGAAIFTNKVKITQVECLFDTNLMGLNVFRDMANIEYISLCLLSRSLNDIADTSTIPQINNKHIYPLPFPHPSVEEQEGIVSYIYEQNNKIDDSIGKAEKQIELLQECRTALISEAVTGKIDVREAV